MKLIVITGCSKGLGLELSKSISGSGYRVLGISRTLSEGFKSLMEENENVSHKLFDLGDVDGIYKLSREISRDYGDVYGLINNAAIGTDGVLSTMHERDIEELIRVNVTSPIVLTKYLSRSFLKKRSGRVINISSIIANTGYSGLSVYAASKASLNGFTKSLSREVGRLGVTVNSIAPGYMETEMTSGLKDDKLESIKRRSALRALATTKDIADMAVYLLSDSGKNITGTIVTIDAGNTA